LAILYRITTRLQCDPWCEKELTIGEERHCKVPLIQCLDDMDYPAWTSCDRYHGFTIGDAKKKMNDL
jgi:hypothetical protein